MNPIEPTFAVLTGGVWHERGSMGWFATVMDAKPLTNWKTQFKLLLESVADDTLLSIFDCHI